MKSSLATDLRRVYFPEDLRFRPAVPADDAFLYQLLVERYARRHVNIPGVARPDLPTFEEHVAHLRAEPYERLEIVQVANRDAGMMFLRPGNVAGCFVLRAYAARGLGLAACYTFCRRSTYPLYTHVHRRNRPAVRTVERLGFERIAADGDKLTYELWRTPLDPFGPARSSARTPAR